MKPFSLVLHRSFLFLDKLSSRSTGKTGRGNSRSVVMLLVGMAEGQRVLSSGERMNVGKVNVRTLTGAYWCAAYYCPKKPCLSWKTVHH